MILSEALEDHNAYCVENRLPEGKGECREIRRGVLQYSC